MNPITKHLINFGRCFSVSLVATVVAAPATAQEPGIKLRLD